MYHSFLIHLFANGNLGCFHVLANVNSAAVSIGVHVFFQIMVFLWVYMPSSGIAGSYGSFILSFYPAIEARTSYLNQRSSGIWDWAAGAFRWVCFCAASSCHVLLPVTSAALGFLCAGFPPLSLDFCCSRFLLCELSLNWAGWDREHCVKKCNCLSGRDWEPVYKC